jgi:hypothetical protein
MICNTKNDASGTLSVPDAEKNEGKVILVPKPGKRSVPHVFGREIWRSKQPSSSQKKEFAAFAKMARERFDDRLKNNH